MEAECESLYMGTGILIGAVFPRKPRQVVRTALGKRGWLAAAKRAGTCVREREPINRSRLSRVFGSRSRTVVTAVRAAGSGASADRGLHNHYGRHRDRALGIAVPRYPTDLSPHLLRQRY